MIIKIHAKRENYERVENQIKKDLEQLRVTGLQFLRKLYVEPGPSCCKTGLDFSHYPEFWDYTRNESYIMPEADKVKKNLLLIPTENSDKQKRVMVELIKQEPKIFEAPQG